MACSEPACRSVSDTNDLVTHTYLKLRRVCPMKTRKCYRWQYWFRSTCVHAASPAARCG
jgi:hypothetical protein